MTALVERDPHSCDAELRCSDGYDPHHCAPGVFDCSCGRQFEHVCDEAEGCFWALVEVN